MGEQQKDMVLFQAVVLKGGYAKALQDMIFVKKYNKYLKLKS